MSHAMIEEARALGITAIATTPHFVPGLDSKETISLHQERLSTVASPKVKLMLSREVRVNTALLARESFGDLTYGGKGKYILLEMPSQEAPTYLEKLLFSMRLDGIVPIIAHPERNIALIHDPKKVIDLIRGGAHMQLTTSSISGELGPTIANFSKAMLMTEMVSFVASDAHNTSTRPFSTWSSCLQAMDDLGVGQDRVEASTTTNPQSVFDSAPIPAVELSRENESRFLALARGNKIFGEKKRKRFFFF